MKTVKNSLFAFVMLSTLTAFAAGNGDNGAQIVFHATAKTPGLSDCTVEILVSQETGMAFQDKIEACQNLN